MNEYANSLVRKNKQQEIGTDLHTAYSICLLSLFNVNRSNLIC